MIDAPLAFALASGMVAAVNPCGFAMLPAYVGFFLGRDRASGSAGAVARAVPVSAAVTAGFITVFGVVGIALRSVSSTVQEYAPWATIVIGVGLTAFGVATTAGFQPNVTLPKLGKGGRTGGLGSMYLYGVSYAVASLTCTIGLFISTIVNSFSRTDFVSGVAILVTYALGMGFVITALTVATALAQDSVVRALRSGMRHATRVGGVLMVAMGAYVTWYGIFSLQVRSDPGAAAGPVDLVEEWSGRASQFVNEVGATRLALILLAAIGVLWSAGVLLDQRRRAQGPSRSIDQPSGVDR